MITGPARPANRRTTAGWGGPAAGAAPNRSCAPGRWQRWRQRWRQRRRQQRLARPAGFCRVTAPQAAVAAARHNLPRARAPTSSARAPPPPGASTRRRAPSPAPPLATALDGRRAALGRRGRLGRCPGAEAGRRGGLRFASYPPGVAAPGVREASRPRSPTSAAVSLGLRLPLCFLERRLGEATSLVLASAVPAAKHPDILLAQNQMVNGEWWRSAHHAPGIVRLNHHK